MKNYKSTKRALLTSVLALLVCVTMLIGSTFAWFTDTVTSGRNTINSGNLDIVLELGTLKADAEKATTGAYAGYYDADDYDWTEVTSTTEIFSDADLFEPGYMKTAVFRVRNAGTLALNYKLAADVYKETEGTNVYGDKFKLSDILDVAFVKGVVDLGSRTTAWVYVDMGASVGAVAGKISDTVVEGSFNAKDDMMYYTMIIGMKETVGNEANYMTGTDVPAIEFGINLLATQRSHEEDSFGKDYDADAEYPVVDNTSLNAALANGGFVAVGGQLDDIKATVPAGVSATLNLNGGDLNGATNSNAIENAGDLTITGEGTITSDSFIIHNTGSATLEGTDAVATGRSYGIVNEGTDAVTVLNDVDIYVESGALAATNGKIVFNSGSVVVDGMGNRVGHVIYASGNSEVEINGGSFVHNRNCTKGAMIYADNNAVVTVNGGSFTKGPNGYAPNWIRTAGNGKVIVKGGKFQFDPSAFVADGYEAVKGSDGWWTVSAK